MSHRTTPVPHLHKLETSTIDGEVRGACTCGWHHRGWVRSLAAVREAHERHAVRIARCHHMNSHRITTLRPEVHPRYLSNQGGRRKIRWHDELDARPSVGASRSTRGRTRGRTRDDRICFRRSITREYPQTSVPHEDDNPHLVIRQRTTSLFRDQYLHPRSPATGHTIQTKDKT